jgi:DNA-3-methyladenine glycosylase I
VDPIRCEWAGPDERMLRYHDEEWGTPSRDDVHLFEMLTLEGAQAGLSWSTILNKREGYRRAFAGFAADEVAAFGPPAVDRLMADPGIVRNRLKIESTLQNAGRIVEVRQQDGSFAAYVWAFVDEEPIVNHWRSLGEIPSETSESREMSRGLKRRGFRFVGPTVCYAFMQAVGMVWDHVANCFRWTELSEGDGADGRGVRS